MKKIILAFIILILSRVSFSVPEDDRIHYAAEYNWMDPEIYQAIEFNAEKYDLNPGLIAALIQRESQGDPRAVSCAGAIGLMQVMPDHLPDNPDLLFDINVNISKGCWYLKRAKDISKGNLRECLRMYNQGIRGDRENYRNWNYVEDILRDYKGIL